MKPPIEVQLFSYMVAFVQQVQRAADNALEGKGISPAQFFILATLARRGELQQSDIANRLGVTPANVSQLVAKLAEAKLVRRTERGKSKLVALTPAGHALVTQLQPEHDAFLRSRFAALSASERQALLGLLERLLSESSAGVG